MASLLQIASYQVPASEWIALCCPAIAGSVLKCWIVFDADMHMRSDPADDVNDYLAKIANGPQFDLPFVGPVNMTGRPICYAQAAAGVVNVTVFGIMQ